MRLGSKIIYLLATRLAITPSIAPFSLYLSSFPISYGDNVKVPAAILDFTLMEF